MYSSNEGKVFLEEFRDFIAFLQNLWGILAGISVLFPVSNALAGAIPLGKWAQEKGGLAYFSPQLVTIVTTLIAIFVILWTFGQRNRFKSRRKRHLIQRQSWFSFACGIFALFVYLALNYAIIEGFYWNILKWESADPRRLLGDIVLLISYSTFFALVTRAFMLLGMLEFFATES